LYSTYETKLGFKIALNRELSTKLIQKNSLPSTAHESQFSDKQKISQRTETKTPSQYWSPEHLTIYTLITKNSLMCLIIYILKKRVQHLLVLTNAPPHIRRLSPTPQHLTLSPISQRSDMVGEVGDSQIIVKLPVTSVPGCIVTNEDTWTAARVVSWYGCRRRPSRRDTHSPS